MHNILKLQKWVSDTLKNADLLENEKIQCALIAGIYIAEGKLKGNISEAWVRLLSDKYSRSSLIIKMKDLYL
jgi:hypothetical protein